MRHLAVGGLLAGIVLALYAPVLSHGFVDYDDDVYLVDNPRLADGLTAENIRWAFTSPYHSNWHPLTWLSWFADVELFGVSSLAFHRTDIVLHAANAVLVYALLLLATRSWIASALAALLFAVHPLRVESVAWASERKDVLSAFFALAATYSYLHYARKPGLQRYAVVALLFVLALLAKPMAVTLPVLWLLLDYWPLARFDNGPKFRRAIMEKIPLIAMSAAAAIVTLAVQAESGAVRSGDEVALADRFAHVPVAYIAYLKQTVWPNNLAVFYPHPGAGWSWMYVVGAGALLVLGTLACFQFRNKWPWLLTGWIWFVLALLPVIGLIQTGAQSHADRYTYLPHVGLALIVAAACAEILRPLSRRASGVFVVAMAAIAMVFAVATEQQIKVWASSETLFAHALARTAKNHVAHNNYGFAIRDADPRAARKHFHAALALKPDYYDAHINLGTSYFVASQYDAALDHYLQAMQLDGSRADAFTNVGLTLMRLNRVDEAIEAYKQALNRAPADATTRMYLADALFAQENWFHAVAQYDIALKLNPKLEKARKNREIGLEKLNEEQ